MLPGSGNTFSLVLFKRFLRSSLSQDTDFSIFRKIGDTLEGLAQQKLLIRMKKKLQF